MKRLSDQQFGENPERSEQSRTSTPQSTHSRGEFEHNKFTPRGDSDQSHYRSPSSGSEKRLSAMRRPLSMVSLSTARDAGSSIPLPGGDATSKTVSLTKEQRIERYDTQKNELREWLRSIIKFTQSLKYRGALDPLRDARQLSRDIKYCSDIRTKASNYISDGKLDCDLQKFDRELQIAIDVMKKYEQNPERHILLDRANPELQPESEVVRHLDTIRDYLGKGTNKPSDEEYVASVEKAVKLMSEPTWREYQNYGVKFAIDDTLDYPKAQYGKKEEGKWEFNLPTNYAYPDGMVPRCIDNILAVELKHAENITSNLQRRAMVMARAFQANMMLGETYGWKIDENYPLAKQYQEDYYDGIDQAFAKGSINIDTPKDTLIQIGNDHAYQKLLERTKPTGDVPDIFLSTLPGSYFEEVRRFEKKRREIKLKQPLELKSRLQDLSSVELLEDGKTLFVKEPVKVGTADWEVLMTFIEARKKEGEEVRPVKGVEKDAQGTLKVAIMPNKEIWALPYLFSKGADGKTEKTQHSIAAGGNSPVWAGEVEIRDGQLIDLAGDSGHFRTYGVGAQQDAIFQFALSAFKAQGYKTEGILDNSKVGIKRRTRSRSNTAWSSMSSMSAGLTNTSSNFSSMSLSSGFSNT